MNTYTITPLRLGDCAVPANIALLGESREDAREFVLYAWLIRAPGHVVLFDCGPREVEQINREAAHVLKRPVRARPEDDLLLRLKQAQVAPEEVEYVVISHLHYDHYSNEYLFPKARVVVSRRALEAYKHWPPDKALWTSPAFFEPALAQPERFLWAEDGLELLPGLRLEYVGAHTPGSQWALVETPRGTVCLAGDALFLKENLERKVPIGEYSNLEEAYAVFERLPQAAEWVFPGHEPTCGQAPLPLRPLAE